MRVSYSGMINAGPTAARRRDELMAVADDVAVSVRVHGDGGGGGLLKPRTDALRGFSFDGHGRHREYTEQFFRSAWRLDELCTGLPIPPFRGRYESNKL